MRDPNRKLMSPHEIEREEKNKVRQLFHWMPPATVIDTGTLTKEEEYRERGAQFWVIEEVHAEVQGQIKWDTRDPDYPRYFFTLLRAPQEPHNAPVNCGSFGSDDLDELIQHARTLGFYGVRGIV